MAAGSFNTVIHSQELKIVSYFCLCLCFLTNVEDEGVAESIVPIVATVDQELCVCEDSAAVPAVAHKRKLIH